MPAVEALNQIRRQRFSVLHQGLHLGVLSSLMREFQKIRDVYCWGSNLFFNTLGQSGLGCVEIQGWVMKATVTVLRPKDRLCQDGAPVAAMYRDMGTTAAEQVVTRALGELALAMSGLAAQVKSHDLRDLARQLRRLQRLSEQLGLLSLCQVAGDVRACVEYGDVTAFSAVWARLLRVAERSLVTEKDILDQSL